MRLSYDYRPSRTDRIYLEVLVWGFSAFRFVCELAALAQAAGVWLQRAYRLPRVWLRPAAPALRDLPARHQWLEVDDSQGASPDVPTFTEGMLIGVKGKR